jgi:hypothetical protein
MGYTTDFDGNVEVNPPLNPVEIAYLQRFAETRRMRRSNGPYYLSDSDFGQAHEDDILDYNDPPEGQPSLWCNWTPSDGGGSIGWDGSEKFYESEWWMQYIIDHFLRPGAVAASSGDPQFEGFTFDHVVNGTIDAQGEDYADHWRLVVKDNEVSAVTPTITWPES